MQSIRLHVCSSETSREDIKQMDAGGKKKDAIIWERAPNAARAAATPYRFVGALLSRPGIKRKLREHPWTRYAIKI
nr:MAG TPA: hypothetical protein [Caudoviricetes sp.]